MTSKALFIKSAIMLIAGSILMGACSKVPSPVTPEPDAPETHITLDRFYDGLYFGDFWDEGYANYYFVLTNCETGYDDESYLLPATVGGYVLYCDLWGAISDDHASPIIPEGTYTATNGRANGTFDLEHTLVTCNKEQVGDQYLVVDILFSDGTIVVEHTDNGYLITATMTTTDGDTMKFSYEGAMTLQDKSGEGEDPEDNVLREDLSLNLKRVTRQQYDEGNSDVDTYILRCFDVDRITDDGLSPYGAGTKLQIGLYTEPGAGLAGSYAIGSRQDYKPGTFYAGSWFGLQAVGTFCMRTDEGNNSKFCLITDGSIDILDNGDGTHTLKCDLKDENGYSVKCEWTGTIEEYAVIESVQSTLTEDLVFNPDLCSEIYFLGDYYYTGTSTYNMTLNSEDGSEVLSIDFCASSGDTSSLPTGTYTVSSGNEANTVSPGRVTLTYAEPSVYVKYDMSTGEAEQMAPVFNGTMTITSNGDGQYTIEYEFYDDYNRNDASLTPHKISGSWSGTIPEIVDYYYPSTASARHAMRVLSNPVR